MPPKIERKISCRCSKKDDFTELAAESSTKERIKRTYKVRISKEVFSPIKSYPEPTNLVRQGHQLNQSSLPCVSYAAVYEASKARSQMTNENADRTYLVFP